jgi:hypothetical protein
MTTHLVKWDIDKRKQINKYLKNEKKLPLRTRLPWRGDQLTKFDVYEIPTSLLFYNFKNTRIRSELEGFLHIENKRLNSNSPQQIKKVHDILLNSKWFGDMATKRLMEDLHNRGQLDPAVARPDGVLIDGNRRLAILRQLEINATSEDSDSDEFSTMYVCFLPDDSSEDDLKALEMRIQMTQSFQVKYGEINTALEFRHLHEDLGWSVTDIEEITRKYYKEKKIRDMIRTIGIIDECLLLLPPKGKYEKQYTQLDKGWEGFANLDRILQWAEKDDPENTAWHKRIKYLGFQIMSSPDTTYADIRKLYKILKQSEASDEIHKTSATLKGENNSNPLSETRIEDEIRFLGNANDVWTDCHESPYNRANDALKKLETIKMRKQRNPDSKLLYVLDRISKKVQELRSKIE